MRLMKYGPVLVILSFLFFGCTLPEDTQGQAPKKTDLSISNIVITNTTPVILGQNIPLKLYINSTNKTQAYKLIVKEASTKAYEQVSMSYGTVNILVPAIRDGIFNITVSLSPAEKEYYDPDATDNSQQIMFYASPIISSRNVSFDNTTTAYMRRSYATKFILDSNASISTVGAVLRRSSILSPNATLHYFIKPDVNGTPADVPIFDANIQLVRVSVNNVFILLRSDETTLTKGTYWFEIYIEDDGAVEIPCFDSYQNISKSSFSPVSTKRTWYNNTCVPYYIISSQEPIYVYKEFSKSS